MELKQARGNTWYLEDWQLIPLYRLDGGRCILLDSGMLSQREEIERVLAAHGLTPAGILGTHIHTDHSPNHRYFQQKYHIPVVLPAGEAGLCVTLLNLKAYLFMLPLGQVTCEEDVREMEVVADRVILPGESRVELCGAAFDILHTPGHSPDHVCVRTPDDVLYLGDAVLTGEELTGAKLPYFFSHREAMASMDRLRGARASCYLAAHRGVYPELGDILSANKAAIRDRAARLLALVDRPMTADQIYAAAADRFALRSSRLFRVSLYERNLRTYVEYLRDTGALRAEARDGLVWYQRAEEK